MVEVEKLIHSKLKLIFLLSIAFIVSATSAKDIKEDNINKPKKDILDTKETDKSTNKKLKDINWKFGFGLGKSLGEQGKLIKGEYLFNGTSSLNLTITKKNVHNSSKNLQHVYFVDYKKFFFNYLFLKGGLFVRDFTFKGRRDVNIVDTGASLTFGSQWRSNHFFFEVDWLNVSDSFYEIKCGMSTDSCDLSGRIYDFGTIKFGVTF